MEKLNKEKNLLSSQTTSQHSTRQLEGQASQVQVLKEEEVTQFKKPEPKTSEQPKELILAGKAKSVLNEGKSTDSLPQALDQLQGLHHAQLKFLENQNITLIPIVLEQLSTDKVPHEGIPYITPQTSSLHAESQAEVRVRSILSAINTISKATVAMIDEAKPCDHEAEIQTLKDKVQQVTTAKEALEDQVIDLQQQLEREQRLVKHSKKTLDKYKDKCTTLLLGKGSVGRESQEIETK